KRPRAARLDSFATSASAGSRTFEGRLVARSHDDRMLIARRFAYPFLLAAVVLGLIAVPGWADLSSNYKAGQQRARQLRSEITAQSQRIHGYQGTIDNLEARLTAIE